MNSTFWFWSHFILVLFSHFFVGVLTLSAVTNFIKSNAPMLDRLRRFSIIFFIAVLGVNHLTNTNSKCILTTLENEARIVEGKEQVGDFLPRFYEVFRW